MAAFKLDDHNTASAGGCRRSDAGRDCVAAILGEDGWTLGQCGAVQPFAAETLSMTGLRRRQPEHVLQEEKPEEADQTGGYRRDDPANDDTAQHRPADARRALQDRDADHCANHGL